MPSLILDKRPSRFDLSAGAVCLDFVNTLDNRPTQPKELLKTYNDLVRFAEESGVLAPAQANSLVERAYLIPAIAAEKLRSAITMREAMYEVFTALVNKQAVPKAALMQLNGYIKMAAQHANLAPAKGMFVWEFDRITSPEGALDPVLWPIARSAADLLSSERVAFIHACEMKSCQWLFLDTSKNHRRQWCSMRVCGNRAKARRFYHKTKSA